jgi:hypothetical protein
VWVRRATNIGVHVGNTDGHDVHPNWPRSMTNHVYMDNIRVEGTLTGYGIEYENLVSDCSLHHFFVLDCVNYGVALAEDTEKIQVTGGYINGITGSNSAGIITSCGQQNEIANNVIRNCDYGIKIQSNASFIIVPNRNIIRGNTIDGTKYAYGINLAAAMPSGVTANMLGPNTITTPTVAFASDHVGGSRTQAQFEGDYPTNIDHSDSVVGSAFPQGTPTESANAIAGTTGMTQRDALAIAALIARAGWTVFP